MQTTLSKQRVTKHHNASDVDTSDAAHTIHAPLYWPCAAADCKIPRYNTLWWSNILQLSIMRERAFNSIRREVGYKYV